ncbi:hypothetical protein HG531_008390 [Fusarium graminearum]|nr:hypothetical protein HG531_008390 [Fusarium graminearum]
MVLCGWLLKSVDFTPTSLVECSSDNLETLVKVELTIHRWDHCTRNAREDTLFVLGHVLSLPAIGEVVVPILWGGTPPETSVNCGTATENTSGHLIGTSKRVSLAETVGNGETASTTTNDNVIVRLVGDGITGGFSCGSRLTGGSGSRFTTVAVALDNLGGKLSPISILGIEGVAGKLATEDALGFMLKHAGLSGTLRVYRIRETVCPTKNGDGRGSRQSTGAAVLGPGSTSLAAVDESETIISDLGRDLGQSGFALVLDRLDLCASPMEGGKDFTIVRVGKEQKRVCHGSAIGETAPSGAFAFGSGAVLL